MSLLVARRGILAAGAAPAPAPSGDYAAEVAADSPFAWWRFEETSGSTVADEIGTNDGTVFGANLDVASFGDTGSAIDFDGVDDYVDIPHASELNAGNTFTLECLLKLDTPDADSSFWAVDKTNTSSSNGQYFLGYDNRSSQGSPQRIRFQCGASGGSAGQADWSGSNARDAIAAGVHLVGTFDVNASVSHRLYANGVEVAASSSGSIGVSGNTLNLRIAALQSSFGRWDGIADEVALYDKVLSTSRIAAHASAAGLGS